MFKRMKKLGLGALAFATLVGGPTALAQNQNSPMIIQGPSQHVDLNEFIQGVWYTEADDTSQFQIFGEDGGFGIVIYGDDDESKSSYDGSYELEQLDERLYKLTITVDTPNGPVVIPDTVMVGSDMASIVSVENGGIFMRVSDEFLASGT